MPDVDNMRSWTGGQKAKMLRLTLPGGPLRGKVKMNMFGSGVTWSDPAARQWWAEQIGDYENAGGGVSLGDDPW